MAPRGKAQPPSLSGPRGKVEPPSQVVPRSQAERDLLKALRMVR